MLAIFDHIEIITTSELISRSNGNFIFAQNPFGCKYSFNTLSFFESSLKSAGGTFCGTIHGYVFLKFSHD